MGEEIIRVVAPLAGKGCEAYFPCLATSDGNLVFL